MLDRLENAFHEAVVLGDREQRKYVDTLRFKDPSLADELQRLLDADRQSDAVIEFPVIRALIRLGKNPAER